VAVAAVLLVAAVAWLSTRRVPEGSVGVTGDGILAAGWRLSAPWAPLRVVPAQGPLEIRGIELRTRDGARLSIVVQGGYVLRSSLSPRLAGDIRQSGLEEALRAIASGVLAGVAQRQDTETLASDPALLEAPFRAALETAGVGVTKLAVGPEATDQGLARRRTEEARALARRPASRLLVIGLDGADWRLIGPWMDDGRLPNLARLAREGAHGNLRSFDPMFSPMLWTTVATGKTPDKHGIADFLVKDPNSDARHPITSDFRKVKALWNIFTDLGRDSGWIAWWATFPAEPCRGVIVSEMLAHSVVRGGPEDAASRPHLVYPKDYLATRQHLLVPVSGIRLEEVRRLFPISEAEFKAAQTKAPSETPKPDSKEPQDPATFTLKLLAATKTYVNIAEDMLRQGLPAVAVYLEGTDGIGHRFQHYLPPKMAMASEEEFLRFQNVIPRFWEVIDEDIGRLLRAAGPDTTLMILSDHGVAIGLDRPVDVPPYTTGQPAEWHRPWGILLLHGPGIRPGELPPSRLFDITPTLLYLMGLPLAEDMPGRMIREAFLPGVLAASPPTRIRSYELVGGTLARRESTALDAEAMSEMMANLQALGYVAAGTTKPASAGTEPTGDPPAGEADTQVYYHRNMATFHIKQRRFADAETELLEANRRKLFPKTFEMLAEVRAAQSRFSEAASALEEGWRELPDQMSPESLLWMAEMHLKAADLDRASSVLSRYGNRLQGAVRTAIEGRIEDARGNRAAAIRLYEQALRENPLLVHVALRLYSFYREDGTPERIEPVLQRGVAASPLADAYQNLLGKLALARGDENSAIDRFRAALQVEPENGEYLGNYALACARAGRSREARETVDWAFRCQPPEPEAWVALGMALDRLGEPDRALMAFEKARSTGSAGPEADIGKVLLLARAGRRQEALRALADARASFPSNPAWDDLAKRLGLQ
jgi:tetratricopeptide (TPR) repeat protein